MTDAELLRRLEDLSLPFQEWTHRAHVRVAFHCLGQQGFAPTLDRLRSAIKAYNAHHGVMDGPTSGYNETTTVAFLHLIWATMLVYGSVMPTQDGEAFCKTHPHLLHRQVLRLYYSPEQRMRPDAKVMFVEPDLAPLPNDSPAADRARQPAAAVDRPARG